jgi:hypothetical protein
MFRAIVEEVRGALSRISERALNAFWGVVVNRKYPITHSE